MDEQDLKEQIANGDAGAPVDAEDWYRRAVEFYRADLELAAGKPIPPFHISSGFTHAGVRRTRTAGQCWAPSASADKRAQIFLNPRFVEPLELINTIVHEVIHATVGVEHGHLRPFSRVAAACGMLSTRELVRMRSDSSS